MKAYPRVLTTSLAIGFALLLLPSGSFAKKTPRAVTLEEQLLDPGDEPTASEFESAFKKIFATTSLKFYDEFKQYRPDLAEYASDNPDGLSINEVLSIYQYVGDGYAKLNDTLRIGKKTPLSDEARVLSWYIFQGLKKIPLYNKETFRVCNLRPELDRAYQVGNYVQQKAFLSTTQSSDFADEFAASNGKHVYFRIKGISGHLLGKLSFHPEEKEVLFPPGATFRVTKRIDGKFDWKVAGASGRENKNQEIEGTLIEMEEISDFTRIKKGVEQVKWLDLSVGDAARVPASQKLPKLYLRMQAEQDLGVRYFQK